MATEDFATYTEVDPNTRITVISSRITVASVTRAESAYVYDDKGAGHFNGDFEHLLEVYFASAEVEGCFYPYGLTNIVGDFSDARGTDYINIRMRLTGGNYTIQLHAEYDNNGEVNDIYTGLSVDTLYYLTIARNTNIITIKIYDDAERTNLLDTLTVELTGASSLRYVYGMQTKTDAASYPTARASGYSQNLDLQEAEGVAYDVTITDSLGMTDSVAKQFDARKTVSDSIGLLDSQVPKWDAHLTVSDKLGMTDSVTKQQSMFQTIADILGLSDTVGTKGAFKQAVTDVLGMLDSATRGFPLAVTISEILGLRDQLVTKKRIALFDLPDHTERGGAPHG